MFIHSALTWGFFLTLVPLAIHLINLVRRRRVKWAAMDFLLQSYKKHQKWVWLQQLLLLFLRMAAVALIVAMLAQWVGRSHWFSLFGGHVTHHYVLLDDSFSMSERFGGASAFDKASQALSRIATQAIAQESPQKMTLLRYSKASGFRKDDTSTAIGRLADFNAEPIDGRFDVLLEEKRRGFEVTQLAVGPGVALELANELMRQSRDESNIVHILSDFRSRDWSNPGELKELLSDVDEVSEQIQFVNCAPEPPQGNLAITDLRPSDEIRAAGVPLFMNVTITNYGTETLRKIPLRIRTFYYDPQTMASAEPGKVQGKADESPAVLIEELGAGQRTTRQIQVQFPRPGQHVVEAILPEDVVSADNRRWCVVNVQDGESVLVIDGNLEQRNYYYLASVFQPGPRAETGIRTESKPASFLRDTTAEALAAYRAIYLLDVERLDERAVENVEAFVRGGGGLGIFVGDAVNRAAYNSQLYRDGEGVFPVPLERADILPPATQDNVPDFDVSDHPLFSVFLGERNPFIRLVNVDRFIRPPLDWSPEPDSGVSVIARLRNRQPFVVEKKFGEGRVVVFLTTLMPEWNNWANDPSFVIVLLKLQSYLAAPLRGVDLHLVGTPLEMKLDSTSYRKDLVFVTPGAKPEFPVVLQRTANPATSQSSEDKKEKDSAKEGEASSELVAYLPGISNDDANSSRSGVYEVWRSTVAGPLEVSRFAFNVDPTESNIALVSSQSLLTNLSPIRVRMRNADEFAFDLTEEAGFSRSIWLMILLLVVLAGEQLLAYFASYHPTTAKGVALG